MNTKWYAQVNEFTSNVLQFTLHLIVFQQVISLKNKLIELLKIIMNDWVCLLSRTCLLKSMIFAYIFCYIIRFPVADKTQILMLSAGNFSYMQILTTSTCCLISMKSQTGLFFDIFKNTIHIDTIFPFNVYIYIRSYQRIYS